MTTPLRHYLEHNTFRFMRMWLQHREIYFIAGTNSLFIPSRSEKYIQYNRPDGTKIVRMWEDAEGEEYEMTPGEAARAELKKTFPGLKRVGWMSSHVKLFDWRWPMMYRGASEGEGVYIDLKGAYHQLYSRLWLDTAFPCGYGTLSLMSIADTLREWKGARNSLIGVCSARVTTGVKGYKTINLHTKNPYLSPGLWATIQAILNELAFEAERMGAIYIATDGYIFPSRSDVGIFIEYLYDCGLSFRESRGEYDIRGWGAYKAPAKETKNFARVSKDRGRGFCSINLFDSDYPKRLTSWWAHSIPTYARDKWRQGEKQCQPMN